MHELKRAAWHQVRITLSIAFCMAAWDPNVTVASPYDREYGYAVKYSQRTHISVIYIITDKQSNRKKKCHNAAARTFKPPRSSL